MLISFLYIISIIFLFSSFLFLKKTTEKQNLIMWIFISFVLFFCYNSIISFVLSFIGIPIYLIILLIINLIVSLILYMFGIRKNSIQKYYVLKKDIVFLILFVIIIIVISYIRFDFPFNIVYNTSDPALHFWTSKDFYEQSYLLNRVADSTIVNFETRQFASYVNLGLLFKVFNPFINSFDFYKLYILFDIFMLLLSGIIFYFTISLNSNKKLLFIISSIGALMYIFGYPLNNMVIGFFYLGHSIVIINLIFLLFKIYNKFNFNNKVFICLLFILNLGLFFTYYYFIPVVFISMFVYFIYKLKWKIFDKKNILVLLLLFIIPLLIGFYYFILPNINNNEQNIFTQLGLDGYCYIEIFGNFYLFIPMLILYFGYLIKNKKLNFEFFSFLVLTIFILIVGILFLNDIASPYYLSKNFYFLWLVVYLCFFNFINQFYSKNKFVVLYFFGILLSIVISIFIFSSKSDKILFKDSYSVSSSAKYFGIYSYNLNKLVEENILLTNRELEDLKKVYNTHKTKVVSNLIPMARLWLLPYFETDKLDILENQFYDYFCKNNYLLINFDNFQNNIILFYRKEIVYSYMSDYSVNYLNDNYKDCKFEEYDSFIFGSCK